MSAVTAVMRPFDSDADETPLDVWRIHGDGKPHGIDTKGFGALIVGYRKDGSPGAVLANGNPPTPIPRDVVVDEDGVWRVELLPNASSEPRLLVVVSGMEPPT